MAERWQRLEGSYDAHCGSQRPTWISDRRVLSEPGPTPTLRRSDRNLLPYAMLTFALLATVAAASPPDITGEWVIIRAHEPRTGTVPVVSCHGRRATWRLEVSDRGQVVGTLIPAHHTSGARRPTRTTATGEVSGTWQQGALVLSGTEVWRTVHLLGNTAPQLEQHPRRFVLTPDKDHLVGTLEERPVRLAPADLTEPTGPCGPPPP
ncbi:MAG: hypothetical protein KTR31_38495 [Myxococcales bacterium]|nr:hypothetical protein [Myxococcales bacterium]